MGDALIERLNAEECIGVGASGEPLMCLTNPDGPEAASRIAELEAAETRWIARFADVREASGIGVKPMLSEVPEAIRARVAELEKKLAAAEYGFDWIITKGSCPMAGGAARQTLKLMREIS